MKHFVAFNRLSLIEEKILAFYETSNTAPSSSDDNFDQFFRAPGCFQFQKIREFLWPEVDDSPSETIFNGLNSYTYEECLECYQKLHPLFRYTEQLLTKGNDSKTDVDWKQLDLQLEWLGEGRFDSLNGNEKFLRKPSEILLTPEQSTCHGLENALLLTALADKALANVYCTVSGEKLAPHLLKDLISSNEVKKIFGVDAAIFLKLLMGLPNSMNLRNIIWHGFPRSGTIPNYYACTLLLTLHSLGVILHEQSTEFQLQQKPLITDLSEFLQPMVSEHSWSELDNEGFQKVLENCKKSLLNGRGLSSVDSSSISTDAGNGDYIAIWLQLIQLYERKDYIRFSILLIPQIELLLRCYYGRVNQIDVMAKVNEYYVIIDTIFAEELPEILSLTGEMNQLLNFSQKNESILVPEGYFKILYDLFLDSEGCRLRDRISHGELDLKSLQNTKLVTILMHLLVVLLNLPSNDNQCYQSIGNYESKYHLNARTKVKLLKTYEEFFEFKEFHNNIKLIGSVNLNQRFLHASVNIFCRPKKEYELMTLIERIATFLQQALVNYRLSLRQHLRQFELHELHSRKRKTLQNMLNAFPVIWRNLIDIWETTVEVYLLLQEDDDTFATAVAEEPTSTKILRSLKHTLCICQNVCKYSSSEINNWNRALQFLHKFQDIKLSTELHASSVLS